MAQPLPTSLSLLATEIGALQRRASLLNDPAAADYFAGMGQTLQLTLLDLYGLHTGSSADPDWPPRTI